MTQLNKPFLYTFCIFTAIQQLNPLYYHGDLAEQWRDLCAKKDRSGHMVDHIQTENSSMIHDVSY